MTNSYARCISLYWLSWSFKAWNPLFQTLQSFKFSLRKHLLLQWVFFHTWLNTFFLSQLSIHFIVYTWYFNHDILWDFLFKSCPFADFCASSICIGMSSKFRCVFYGLVEICSISLISIGFLLPHLFL